MGELQGEACSLAGSAAQVDARPVGVGDMFDDRQSDADPLGLSAKLGATAVETLKDFFMILLGNAWALVLDP